MIYLMKTTAGINLAAFYTLNAAVAHALKTYNVSAWARVNGESAHYLWRGASDAGTTLEIEQVPLLDIRRL